MSLSSSMKLGLGHKQIKPTNYCKPRQANTICLFPPVTSHGKTVSTDGWQLVRWTTRPFGQLNCWDNSTLRQLTDGQDKSTVEWLISVINKLRTVELSDGRVVWQSLFWHWGWTTFDKFCFLCCFFLQQAFYVIVIIILNCNSCCIKVQSWWLDRKVSITLCFLYKTHWPV